MSLSILVIKSQKEQQNKGILWIQKRKRRKTMSVKKFNREEFEIAKKEAGVILLDFYADWCGPCRMVAPVVEEVSKLRKDVLVGKINVDDEEALAREFEIVSIPTLIVLKNGKVHKKVVGARNKEQLLALLES